MDQLIVHIPLEEGISEKPGFDANLPADVRYDSSLSPMARLIYAEIRALSSKLGFCWATNGYFARVFEIDERSVMRCLKQLKENNYIRTHRAQNDVDGKMYRIIQIAGSKFEPEGVTKMSPEGRQKCHQKGDKNVTHVISNNNNYIYNRACARVTQKQKNFNNFSQRNYDMAELEKVLLNRSVEGDSS